MPYSPSDWYEIMIDHIADENYEASDNAYELMIEAIAAEEYAEEPENAF